MKMFRNVFLVVVLFGASHIEVQAWAQAAPNLQAAPPGAAARSEADEVPEDSLGRSTPHGAVVGFLQTAQHGNYREAAQYLQLSNDERARNGAELARKLHALMDNAFLGRVGAITQHREGSIQPGVVQDHEQIGTLRLNGSETPVDLVHVSDPRGGEIWLFSSQTLAQVPELFEQIESDELGSRLPGFLSSTRILRTPLWRWISFVLLIPAAIGMAWVILKVVSKGRKLWLRSRQYPILEDIHDSLTAPTVLILSVVLHRIAVRFLGVPLLFRLYYQRAANIVLVAGLAWLAFRIVNRWGRRARTRALSSSKNQSGSIILLGERIINVLIVIIAGLMMLSIAGVNLTAAIAGLGIGSIALAFAAQKTLENLLGGVSIIGDEVIRVGEVCRIEEQLGVVEGISLRSTRIRTLQRTELSVPNGQLATMNLENLSRRDKFLFEITIGLRQETSPAQMRSFLEDVRKRLLGDARVAPENFRVRFIGIGESSFDLEIFCYIRTRDLREFFAIREDLMLQILDLMAAKGIGLASPVRTLHLPRDQYLDHQKLHRDEQQRRRAA
jgi:MscS family membrane protein